MILMHSSGPSASKPLHDNTAKREQNLHYGYYNGLITGGGARRAAAGLCLTPGIGDSKKLLAVFALAYFFRSRLAKFGGSVIAHIHSRSGTRHKDECRGIGNRRTD
jgi:hypothetical protein